MSTKTATTESSSRSVSHGGGGNGGNGGGGGVNYCHRRVVDPRNRGRTATSTSRRNTRFYYYMIGTIFGVVVLLNFRNSFQLLKLYYNLSSSTAILLLDNDYNFIIGGQRSLRLTSSTTSTTSSSSSSPPSSPLPPSESTASATKTNSAGILEEKDDSGRKSETEQQQEGPCRMLVSSKHVDYHYEVLESIAVQYPVRWDNTGFDSCSKSSDKDHPIVVDFFLPYLTLKHDKISKVEDSEVYGWKVYYEKYIQGQIVPRRIRQVQGDLFAASAAAFAATTTISTTTGADITPEEAIALMWNDTQAPVVEEYIQYGSILYDKLEIQERLASNYYHVQVENNCMLQWKNRYFKYLNASINNYCVTHDGIHLIKPRLPLLLPSSSIPKEYDEAYGNGVRDQYEFTVIDDFLPKPPSIVAYDNEPSHGQQQLQEEEEEESRLLQMLQDRICYLNPQHSPHCWFLPSTFPQFRTPNEDLEHETTSMAATSASTPSTSRTAAVTTAAAPTSNSTLNVCVNWKSELSDPTNGTVYRNYTLLASALSTIEIDANVQILVIGRQARIPTEFEHLLDIDGSNVTIKPVSDVSNYYEYQKLIATSCHVMIPLLHPEDENSQKYFLPKGDKNIRSPILVESGGVASDGGASGGIGSVGGGTGLLSGMISQIIGHKIPSVLHRAVAEIYGEYLTAPTFTYDTSTATTRENGNEIAGFNDAFLNMLYYFGYQLRLRPDPTGNDEFRPPEKLQPKQSSQQDIRYQVADTVLARATPSAPPKDSDPILLHFIYVSLNETCHHDDSSDAPCEDGRDIHDILREKQPSRLYSNIQDMIHKYRSAAPESVNRNIKVMYHGNAECHDAIRQTKPELLPHYLSEPYGPHKSDICRLAVLYLHGGYYLDNDTKVLKAVFLPKNKSFSTVVGISRKHFAQGFIAVSRPDHPIIALALLLTQQHYQEEKHMRDSDETVDYSKDTGTKILYDAYHHFEIVQPQSSSKYSYLLQEAILKRDEYKHLLGSQIPEGVRKRMKMRVNYCTAAFISSDKEKKGTEEVYMLARAPGTSYC